MEEVLVPQFARAEEEPRLCHWYIPDLGIGCHGKTMLRLYGRESFLPIKGERLYSPDERGLAESRLKTLREPWEKRELTKKLSAQQAKKPAKKP